MRVCPNMCVLLATACVFTGSLLGLLVFDVIVWFYVEHTCSHGSLKTLHTDVTHCRVFV